MARLRLVQPRLLAHLQAVPNWSAVRLDSMSVRAHVRSAGAPKKKETEPALGCSWGDFRTQISILADRQGRPLRLRVMGGPRPHPSPGSRGSLG